jgi:peptidyl-dipeptidase A
MRNAARFSRLSPLAIIPTILLMGSLMAAQFTSTSSSPTAASQPQPTLAEAQEFIAHAETRLNELAVKASRAAWIQANFITDDTEIMSAEANEAAIGATTELAKQATRFDNLQMPPDLARCSSSRPLFPPPRPPIPRNSPS